MKRILFAIPIPWNSSGGFWTRDSGLLVLALRKMGYDSHLITLGEGGEAPAGSEPMITARLEDLKSPVWWKGQKPDAVVLNTWSAPRYDAIRKAALAATPLVMERLDTSGIRSPRIWYRQALLQTYGGCLDGGSGRLKAGIQALLKHHAALFFPGLMDIPMAKTMGQLPVLAVESPLALARMKRHMSMCGVPSPRMLLLPHPVNTEQMDYDGCAKEKRVISVGRWETYQKDLPFVLKVMRGFLERHPDWEFDLVGAGVSDRVLKRHVSEEGILSRIHVHGPLDHSRLAECYRRSRIYLMASRWESFCIAAAEALCCGCSVVAGGNIASSGYFASKESGAVSHLRHPAHFNDALESEVCLWESGKRDPFAISRCWREETGAGPGAEKLVQAFESLGK